MEVNVKMIAGLLARHAIGAAGTWLVTKGYMDADPAVMQTFSGACLFLGAIGWSVVQKLDFVQRLRNAIGQAVHAEMRSNPYGAGAQARGQTLQNGVRPLVLALLAVCVSHSDVRAADMILKAPVKQRILETYRGAGWYYGVHTFAENDKLATANSSTLGGNFAVGAALGLTMGYMWGGNGVAWQALEAMASYKNISGGIPVPNTTLQVDSKWSFTQRFKFGGPTEVLLAGLPNMGTVFPSLPAAPAGVVGTSHPYLFGALHEDDISESIGLPLGRAWRFKGGFGVGLMQQLGKAQNNPNGATVVADVWAEYIPASSAVTVGAPADFLKTNTGRETRFGLSILY